ncbi:MAG TPA: sulfatase-like hydrolase/transferase, partial [Thermoanaerobaculia bacterium]|nr:sulfatase-like hydrolase/transferase [Thermoanaerobaculia bacterium]
MRTTSWPIAALLLLGCSPSPETRPARPIGPPVAAEARALGIDDLVAASGPGVVLFDARDGEPLALPWGSVRNLTLGEGFGAGEADVLELEVVDLPRPGAIEVRWRSSEGEDAGLAVLSATGRDAMDGGRLRYALGRSPAWRGRPGEVRLSYSGPRDATPRLLSARLIVLEVDPAKVSELAGEAWRVEIDHELRTASLTTRGVPVRAELPVSGAARLTIEAGVVAGPAAALAVEVAFLGGSGEVLDRVRKTGDPLSAEAGWQRLGFDLAPPARTRGVRLAIEPAPGTVAAPTAIAVSDVTWRPDGPGDAPPRGHRNVVLISIDTLRADRLSSSSGRPERTPALEAWRRRRAVQFDVAWSAAPSTLPSHASMFTGVGPLRHGAYLET